MSKNALVYRLSADNKRLQKDLDKSKRHLKRFQDRSKGISAGITRSLGSMFAIGTVAAFGRELVKTTEDYDKQAKAIAQVEQAVISTGAAANKTLYELQQTAQELQKNTLFGDEDILQNATAQLLTFTNIAGDNFDRTQRAALDLSTRLDGDLKSASIQLGKALNDPVANLSALSRSGIQFSKEQTAVIKQLANTNQLAEAQAIILKELENQYGGSAEAAAAAGTGGWQQLSNSFGDLREQIGQLIAENSASKGLAGWFKEITEDATSVTRALNSQLSGWDKFKMGLAKAFGGTSPGLAAYGNAIEQVGNALQDQEEKVRSEEAAQEAATVARQKQVDAIRSQVKAFEDLKAASTTSNLTTVGTDGPQMANIGPLNLSDNTEYLQQTFEQYRDQALPIIEQVTMLQQQLANAFGGLGVTIGSEGFQAALKQASLGIVDTMADQLIQVGLASKAMAALLASIKKSLFTAPQLTLGLSIAAIGAGIALKGAVANAQSSISSSFGGGGGGSGRGGSGSFQNNVQGQSIQLNTKPIEIRFQNGSLAAYMQFENAKNGRLINN